MRTFSHWSTLLTFRDGKTYRQRGIYINFKFAGIEERIFNPDGSLCPLPDGRTSSADTHP